MFGAAEMREIREAVGRYAAGFDAALVTAADAQRIVEDAVAASNMLATVVGLAGCRVSETELWRKEGDASPAHQLARKSGTSVAKAREALETAGRLGALPAVEAAARAGELSPAQTAPIAEAASKAPAAERRLLVVAKTGSLGELIDNCARTKAAAEPDDQARHEAIHQSRFLRRRRTGDGAGELHYRSTLEEVAEIFAIAQGWAERRFKKARSEGRHESGEAYLADGLLDAARASQTAGARAPSAGAAGAAGGSGVRCTDVPVPAGRRTDARVGPTGPPSASEEPFPEERLFAPYPAASPDGAAGGGDGTGESFPAEAVAGAPADPAAVVAPAGVAFPRPPSPVKVIVRADLDALLRGWPIEGEVVEISGLGPIPVSAVRAMIESGNVFLAALATTGVDVVSVVHLGRKATAHQRTALEWLNPTCTTLGCNTAVRLEIDHRVPWADSKVTLLALLDRPCDHCHDLRTYQGWAYVEGTGKRALVPPDDPRHPRNNDHGRERAACVGGDP